MRFFVLCFISFQENFPIKIKTKNKKASHMPVYIKHLRSLFYLIPSLDISFTTEIFSGNLI